MRFSRQFLKIFKNCLETLEKIFETLGDSKNSRNSPQFRILLQHQKTQETYWNSKYSSKLLIFLKILVTSNNSSKLIKELRVSGPSDDALEKKCCPFWVILGHFTDFQFFLNFRFFPFFVYWTTRQAWTVICILKLTLRPLNCAVDGLCMYDQSAQRYARLKFYKKLSSSNKSEVYLIFL